MDTIEEVLGAAREALSDPDTYFEGAAIAAFLCAAAVIIACCANMPT